MLFIDVESRAEVISRLLRDVRITVSYGMTEGKVAAYFHLACPLLVSPAEGIWTTLAAITGRDRLPYLEQVKHDSL